MELPDTAMFTRKGKSAKKGKQFGKMLSGIFSCLTSTCISTDDGRSK